MCYALKSEYEIVPISTIILNSDNHLLQVGAAEGGRRKVFVIDEIGKMELFSQSFIRSVRQTLDGSSFTILGTIPIPKGKPLGLVEEVRNRRDVKVFTVSKKYEPGKICIYLGHINERLRLTIAIGRC